MGERRDDLRLAVFENFEIVEGQAADRIALCVGDERVELNRVDLDAERRLLRRREAPGEDGGRDAGKTVFHGVKTIRSESSRTAAFPP